MCERQPVPSRDQESVQEFIKQIPHYYEQQFALILLSIPTLDVFYEPHRLTGMYKDETRSTQPDFFVINTKNPQSKGVYIELTSVENIQVNNYDPKLDPKARQRAILKQNGVKHVIFYRGNLEYLEEQHGIDFKLVKARCYQPVK